MRYVLLGILVRWLAICVWRADSPFAKGEFSRLT